MQVNGKTLEGERPWKSKTAHQNLRGRNNIMATSAVTRLTRNSIEARELKAIELRNSGNTILQITNETNLSKGSVESLLKRVKRNNNYATQEIKQERQ
jgi:hypothetical protein